MTRRLLLFFAKLFFSMRPSVAVLAFCLFAVAGAGCSWERPEDVVLAKPAPVSDETPDESAMPARAPRDGKSVAARLEDATLTAQVTRALMDERSLRPFAFDPISNSGRVTLHGDVNTRAAYDRAARIAQDVPGVRAVTNEITVNGQPLAEAQTAAPPTPARPAPPEPIATSGAAAYHTVHSGESLWTIARRSGTTPEAIKRLNNLSSDKLKPGQRLVVRRGAAPSVDASSGEAASEETSSSSASYHTVESGESLWTIARRNGLSIDRLKRLNGLSSNTVKPGQRLRVN